MMIIDLPSDRGFVHFARLTNSVLELPEFVKEASAEGCSQSEELPIAAFADVINRKFPVHTKAAAYLSYLYFRDQEEKFTKEAFARVAHKFESAAEIWGISTEFAQYDNVPAPVEKQAATSAYALNTAGQSFFPIDYPGSTMKSAGELVSCRKNFTYEMRKEAATNIMRAAVAHGLSTLDVPEELHKMAGFGLCNQEAVVHELERRVCYAAGSDSVIGAAMTKLASQAASASHLSPEDMTKIAVVVDTYDRELKINELYGESFQFPEDVFFGAFTEKTAAHLKESTVSMITGNTYTLDELSKSADALKVFGEDFHSDVVRSDGSVDLQKVADVLPTMPRDEAALFDRVMESVEPAEKRSGWWDDAKQTAGDVAGTVGDVALSAAKYTPAGMVAGAAYKHRGAIADAAKQTPLGAVAGAAYKHRGVLADAAQQTPLGYAAGAAYKHRGAIVDAVKGSPQVQAAGAAFNASPAGRAVRSIGESSFGASRPRAPFVGQSGVLSPKQAIK